MAATPILYQVTIRPAWYQTLLFRILLILLITGVIAVFMILFFRSKIRKQKNAFEKQLAIRNERERISAEIHDDIGAGLSGVRLFTELTGNKISDKESKEDLRKIHTSITDLSAKMKEVVWSLNTSNDTLEQLLKYIDEQGRLRLQHSLESLSVSFPAVLPVIQIGSDKRTDIYLSVKEALHNVLQHAGATAAKLDFSLVENRLLITVSDNGKGLQATGRTGNGMLNMKRRIERLQGTLAFHNKEGLTIAFSIPLN